MTRHEGESLCVLEREREREREKWCVGVIVCKFFCLFKLAIVRRWWKLIETWNTKKIRSWGPYNPKTTLKSGKLYIFCALPITKPVLVFVVWCPASKAIQIKFDFLFNTQTDIATFGLAWHYFFVWRPKQKSFCVTLITFLPIIKWVPQFL